MSHVVLDTQTWLAFQLYGQRKAIAGGLNPERQVLGGVNTPIQACYVSIETR